MIETTTDPLEYYSHPGMMTGPGEHGDLFDGLPDSLAGLCEVAQGVLMHPFAAHLYGVKLQAGRKKRELDIRAVSEMLAVIRERDERPLTMAREPGERLVGNCRDFATFTVAMLRHKGVPARVRVGFATYFGPEMNHDHWVVEYWNADQARWVLVDSQLDGVQREANRVDFDTLDVPRDRFIVAGRAWQMCRAGEANSGRFGFNNKLRGMNFIRGSVVQDLVSLNKVEVLPWDTWWELVTKDRLSAEETTYVDRMAALTLGGNDAFREVRAAYEGDPLLYLPVQAHFVRGDQGSGIRDQGRQQSDPRSPIPDPRERSEPAQSLRIRALFRRAQAAAGRQAPVIPVAGARQRITRLEPDKVVVRGAQQHNLKNIDVSIPRYKFVVLTGVSGSGKSSLAFDTIYAEGQRRYVESLSPYVRRYLEKVEKPKVDYIGGLSPAISIEQKTVGKNPRSSVGSITEVNDYLRLLYSRIGTPHCLKCGAVIEPRSTWEIAAGLATLTVGTRFEIRVPSIEYRVPSRGGSRTAATPNTFVVPEESEEAQDEFMARLTGQVSAALRMGNGVIEVDVEGERARVSDRRVCAECGAAFPELSSGAFSPNSPSGMCAECNGLGTTLEVDPELIVADPGLSVMDGAIRWYGNLRKKKSNWHINQVEATAQHYDVDIELPWRDLPQEFRDVILYGSGDEKVKFTVASEWDGGSWSGESVRVVKGLVYHINRLFRQTRSEDTRRWYASFMSRKPCESCGGTRLIAEARSVTLGGKTITEVGQMPLDAALAWADGLYATLSEEQLEIAGEALKEVRDRLQFMLNVGLHYLTLDRAAPTLSGGEGQRIRLASQLGCGLVGVLYVLDEPSIGLHARDQRTLLDTLLMLRDMGNTVLVVEHDAETMRSADWLIDLGPGAGILGGEVVSQGPPEAVAGDPGSLTGRYLSGQMQVTAPTNRRREPTGGLLTVSGARLHNLKNLDASFPIGLLTCVTGVSGSGKSSLVAGTLYPALVSALSSAKSVGAVREPPLQGLKSGDKGPWTNLDGVERLDKVINITQDAIGRTPRSNPATYVGLYDDIRKIYAGTPEARAREYKADRFSFNVKGGRCEACKGHGQNVIQMHFLADVWVVCKDCGGSRFNRETLAVRYKGKHIADVLQMDVQEALEFFADHKPLARTLQTLHDVGLDYLKLGQSATTLSGGEAQRVKLARELSRLSTGRTLYILDEPTTGLHFADIQRLLDVLHRLVDAGNSVIVTEHNMDVIKTADWVIDLGPEGGEGGGYIIAQGPPEAIAQVEASHTGRFLRGVLAGAVEEGAA